MRKYKISAIILCSLMLSACKVQYENETSAPNEESSVVSSSAVSSEENSGETTEIGSVRLTENNVTEEFALTAEQWKRYCGIINDVVSEEPLEIAAPKQDGGVKIAPVSGGLPEYFYMTKLCDGFSEYLYTDNTAYPVSDEFNKFIEELMDMSPENRLIGASFKCAKPVTDEQRLHAAEGAVGAWLETLKSETGRWHIDDYFIAETVYDAPQIAAVSEDGSTFAACVWFENPDSIAGFQSDSVFARYADSRFVNRENVTAGVYRLFK